MVRQIELRVCADAGQSMLSRIDHSNRGIGLGKPEHFGVGLNVIGRVSRSKVAGDLTVIQLGDRLHDFENTGCAAGVADLSRQSADPQFITAAV